MNFRRIMVLFMLVGFFSVTAQAFDLSSFRLRIEDPVTGVGRVITDNVSLGFGNNAGDQNSAAGTVYFSGFVENFNVSVQATSTTVNPDGSGGGKLVLSARVTYSQSTNATIIITLEDSGYTAPAPPVVFTGSVGGYDSVTKTATQAGSLSGGAQSVTVQSWLDAANTEPTFGPNSGSTVLNPFAQTIPPLGSNTTTAFASPVSFGTTGFALSGAGVAVPLVGGQTYSMFSQATVSFTGNGAADFTLTAIDPQGPTSQVPEPTSLMLLGSALLGLEVARRKKQA